MPKAPTAILKQYIHDLKRVYSTGEGVPETSYYGALERLINSVGRNTDPGISAVINLRNSGAGIPDGGLFAANQLRRVGGQEAAFERQLPTQGAIEAKPFGADLGAVIRTAQVRKYATRYGKVLVSNFLSFRLVTQGKSRLLERESFSLADSIQDLVALEASDQFDRIAQELYDYMNRALTAGAPINKPEDLAYFLAAYAKQALERIEDQDLSALDSLENALDQALGISFEGPDAHRFFRSTLVQTLFYGVFSAWVYWCNDREEGDEKFNWRTASWFLSVPVVRMLFEQVSTASRLRPLRLDEILDWAGEALNRVNRDAFFSYFEAADAVQYFYEPFLAEFDPQLRKDLGIWYTPPEVVSYIVQNVDNVLKEELGCRDGLADERVWVLDPCVGTGSFLLEVLRVIQRRLTEGGGDALTGQDLKRAATSRIIGFEILPAPFVIAHLQLGSFLQNAGAPLNAAEAERVAVFLTNALTGWSEDSNQTHLTFPELEKERDSAQAVKKEAPILVVLGNPPYNAFAGVSPKEEGDLLDAYKSGLKGWGITRHNLDDLYVRFFRVAERRIAEKQGEGIVSFISNFSYLGDPSLVAVRQRVLAEFDKVAIDNLNGDGRETGKRTPDGKDDPSVFRTERNRSGINQGTAIGTFVRKLTRSPAPEVTYRDFWGVGKRKELLDSLSTGEPAYASLAPREDTAYTFRPAQVHERYFRWPRVDELAEESPLLGLLEKRKGALIAFSRPQIEARMMRYFDETDSTEHLAEDLRGLREPAARFADPNVVRQRLIAKGGYRPENVGRYLSFPFDQRWAYLEPTRPLWNEPRPDLIKAMREPNPTFFLARKRVPRALDGAAFYLFAGIGDEHALHKDAYYFPVMLPTEVEKEQGALFDVTSKQPRANLSGRTRDWLTRIGCREIDHPEVAATPWLHALAVGFSPAYLEENRDGGRFNFQRVPLPLDKSRFDQSVELGRKISSLLDVELAVEPLFESKVWDFLRLVGNVSGTEGALEPSDLRLKSWASIQPKAVMPVAGRTETRPWSPHEIQSYGAAAAALGLSPDRMESQLGSAVDVYLNGRAFWASVPEKVWDYRVGGYSVLRKWLSYRDDRLLKRALDTAEVRQFSAIVKKVTALLLLSDELDANYVACRDDSLEWHTEPVRPEIPE
ncbi:type ISP restriction/modification enzyme [Streptomyces tendae]|uniref:site-specific DNA-methyltransferase (adenine-specific) n=1 Tax=Streptomyces tendae TaxID=1932 RepID=A0ABX5ZMA5_STRTE|nr:type ISP restriction/modification enzyme [Streptomyces tendae]QER84591.1 N-6 DNA methylase [Streptomyces tendae]